MKVLTNWAGNQKYGSTAYFEPQSLEEIIQIVRESSRIKSLGTKHCFNQIADTSGTHLSLRKMNRLLSVDEKKMICIIEPVCNFFIKQFSVISSGLHKF